MAEVISEEKPFRFLFGANVMLKDFELNVFAKEEGDEFDFVVHFERGYGPYKEKAVLEVPQSAFEVDGKVAEDILKVGTTIPMKDKEGKPMHGRITSIDAGKVKLDFNPPLAGKHLHFKGKILKVREASIQEIAQGRPLG